MSSNITNTAVALTLLAAIVGPATASAGCDSIRGGEVCVEGGDINIDMGGGDDVIEVTLVKDFVSLEAWIHIRVIVQDGWYSGDSDTYWNGPKAMMQPADSREAGLWNWQYFDVNVALGGGDDEFWGFTEDVNAPVGEPTRQFLVGANVKGQGNNDVIVGATKADGGDAEDHIWGTPYADVLRGGKGGDLIYGLEGDDDLLGQRGSDELYGDKGHDYLNGGDGDFDYCFGGRGGDTFNHTCEHAVDGNNIDTIEYPSFSDYL